MNSHEIGFFGNPRSELIVSQFLWFFFKKKEKRKDGFVLNHKTHKNPQIFLTPMKLAFWVTLEAS